MLCCLSDLACQTLHLLTDDEEITSDHSHFICQRLIPSISIMKIIIWHVRLTRPGCPCEMLLRRAPPSGMSLLLLQINFVWNNLVLLAFLDNHVHPTCHNVWNCSALLHKMSVLNTWWSQTSQSPSLRISLVRLHYSASLSIITRRLHYTIMLWEV